MGEVSSLGWIPVANPVGFTLPGSDYYIAREFARKGCCVVNGTTNQIAYFDMTTLAWTVTPIPQQFTHFFTAGAASAMRSILVVTVGGYRKRIVAGALFGILWFDIGTGANAGIYFMPAYNPFGSIGAITKPIFSIGDEMNFTAGPFWLDNFPEHLFMVFQDTFNSRRLMIGFNGKTLTFDIAFSFYAPSGNDIGQSLTWNPDGTAGGIQADNPPMPPGFALSTTGMIGVGSFPPLIKNRLGSATIFEIVPPYRVMGTMDVYWAGNVGTLIPYNPTPFETSIYTPAWPTSGSGSFIADTYDVGYRWNLSYNQGQSLLILFHNPAGIIYNPILVNPSPYRGLVMEIGGVPATVNVGASGSHTLLSLLGFTLTDYVAFDTFNYNRLRSE